MLFPSLPTFLCSLFYLHWILSFVFFLFEAFTVRALNGLDITSATAFHTCVVADQSVEGRKEGRVAKLISHPPLSFVLFRCLLFCFGNALCLTVSMTFKLIQLKHLISIYGVYNHISGVNYSFCCTCPINDIRGL